MAEIATFDGAARALDSEALAEQEVAALMAQVGDRVRNARQRKGIPRRVLSEMSGVSPRYLAQLEAGAGNISIGLLKRVALALDHKIEWFVGSEDPWNSESMRVAKLFEAADRTVQDVVLEALNPGSNSASRAERICLIGLRGAGKSTLGRYVAERLDLPFLELNKEIALYGGMPIDEILALYGQEGYRKLEASSLDRVVENYDSVLLAVAGGIVSDPETYNKLLANFHTVWLRATPQEHMDRVRAQGDERPMADNPDAMDQLKSILTSREALYARANAQLNTSGATVEGSTTQLIDLIKKQKFVSASD